jgi:hypothetical protein
MREMKPNKMYAAFLAALVILVGSGDVLAQDVQIEFGTYAVGDTVVVCFEVEVADPFPTGVDSVANQGVVSGDNFPDVLTDDPDTPEPSDPTVTVVIPDPTPVLFSSLGATSQDGHVRIGWIIASRDMDMDFHVLRAEFGTDDFVRVTDDMIRGDAGGLEYEFIDRTVTPGETYVYRLEVIYVSGDRDYFDTNPVTVSSGTTGRLTLRHNQPNPFNPRTVIAFELPSAGPVTLRIFDANGRLVRTLVNAQLPPDLHTVEWDGRDDSGESVGSGIYMYQLEFGSKRLSRKMVLLK